MKKKISEETKTQIIQKLEEVKKLFENEKYVLAHYDEHGKRYYFLIDIYLHDRELVFSGGHSSIDGYCQTIEKLEQIKDIVVLKKTKHDWHINGA